MLAEIASAGTPLPQDVAAERAVIASCLLRADGLHAVRELLAPEDFLVEPLADVFRSMVRLADGGKPVEMLLVRDQLEHDHALARVGGGVPWRPPSGRSLRRDVATALRR